MSLRPEIIKSLEPGGTGFQSGRKYGEIRDRPD